MKYLFIILACSMLNRARGDDRWMGGWLRGRPLFYVAPAIGLLSYLLHPWQVSLAFALTYLFWGTFAWGRWFDLGRLPDGYNRVGIEPTPIERVIERLSNNDWEAMAIRHSFAVPGLIVICFMSLNLWLLPVAFVFGITVTALYEIAWTIRPNNPIIYAELMTGAFWGTLIVGSSL